MDLALQPETALLLPIAQTLIIFTVLTDERNLIMIINSGSPIKKSVLLITFGLVLLHFLTFFYGYAQVSRASPLELVNLSVINSFNANETKVMPFLFRAFFARREIESRPLEEITSGVGGIKTIYWVIGFDTYDNEKNRKAKKILLDISGSLLSRGMNVDERDMSGCSSLQSAIINRDVEGVEFLLEEGASTQVDPNSPNKLCATSVDSLLNKYLPDVRLDFLKVNRVNSNSNQYQ